VSGLVKATFGNTVSGNRIWYQLIASPTLGYWAHDRTSCICI